MASKRIGKLAPRYTFILNPYPDERLSKCPLCHKLTHPRKFALFVHVEGWGPLVLGKTTVYCAPCELIVVHQAELEAELAHTVGPRSPEVLGNEYLVLGTVEKSVWKQSLGGAGGALREMLDHTAEFKKVLVLKVDPGGWFLPDHPRVSGGRHP
jgi:hypothetical protein